MALGKKQGAIAKFGGGSLQIREVDIAGTAIVYSALTAKTYKVGDRFTNASKLYKVVTGYTSTGTWVSGTDGVNTVEVPKLDAYTELSYLQETTLNDKENNLELIRDETGNIVQTQIGEIEVRFSGTFMQTDKDLLTALRESRGKFYRIKYAMGSVNGLTQTFYAAIAVLLRNIEIKSGAKRIPFEFVLLQTATDVTVDSGKMVLTNEFYLIDEV